MILLPYRLDASLYRIPAITILICILCIATFMSQLNSEAEFHANSKEFCEAGLSADELAIVDHIGGGEPDACPDVFLAIRGSGDADQAIEHIVTEVNGLRFSQDLAQDIRYKDQELRDGYNKFQLSVPESLTERIEYKPGQYNVLTMITSTFAHANLIHLAGNLFFFWVFASCVECILGEVHFCLCFLLLSIICSVAYSHGAHGLDALPTIGLSGVAMGMMTLLTTLLPRARIWCFFWFVLWVRWFTIPVIAITIWFVGWNIYDLHASSNTGVNYLAHVSGAIMGIVLGLLYRMFSPQRMDAIAAVVDS